MSEIIEKPTINVMKVRTDAMFPSRSHEYDAGLDLYANDYVLLNPGELAKIPTGISIEIPKNHVGLIWPRSGMAVKFGIDTLGGVIDCGYTGEIFATLINHGNEVVHIPYHSKIAQILIQKVELFNMVEVDYFQKTDRGDAGFGSTG